MSFPCVLCFVRNWALAPVTVSVQQSTIQQDGKITHPLPQLTNSMTDDKGITNTTIAYVMKPWRLLLLLEMRVSSLHSVHPTKISTHVCVLIWRRADEAQKQRITIAGDRPSIQNDMSNACNCCKLVIVIEWKRCTSIHWRYTWSACQQLTIYSYTSNQIKCLDLNRSNHDNLNPTITCHIQHILTHISSTNQFN